ncbi:hypothetical protein H4R35_004859 [Dimargaris xerosporica]|nr:hypothetical protein H4R35_004859 [Dimargaris xerosporica]
MAFLQDPGSTCLTVLDPARIRVLVVPVGRITHHRFQYYAHELLAHRTIALQDLHPQLDIASGLSLHPLQRSQSSPGDPSSGPADLTSTHASSPATATSGGRGSLDDITQPPRIQPEAPATDIADKAAIFFHFVDSVNRELEYLEHLQTHRQVLGIIGVMEQPVDEALGTNDMANIAAELERGHQRFLALVEKFPTALVSRCLVFRRPPLSAAVSSPTTTAADPRSRQHRLPSVKGIIPVDARDPQTLRSFMQILMRSFASTMVSALGSMTTALETYNYVPPNSLAMLSPTSSNPPPQSPTFASYLKQRQTATQSNQSSPNSLPSPKPPGVTTSTQLPLSARLQSSAVSQSHHPALASVLSPSESTRPPPLTLPPTRTQGSSQGKIKKLMGDTCLLAGKLSEAISYYSTAIEHAKSNQDYIWQAAALEGYYATLLLLALRKSEKALLMALLCNPIGTLVSGLLPADSLAPPSAAQAAALQPSATHTLVQALSPQSSYGLPGSFRSPSPTLAGTAGGSMTNPGSANSAATSPSLSATTGGPSKPRTAANLLQSSLRNSTQMAYFVLSEVLDKYREVPILYEQASVYSPILHIEACLRFAHAATIIRRTGLSDQALITLVSHGVQSTAMFPTWPPSNANTTAATHGSLTTGTDLPAAVPTPTPSAMATTTSQSYAPMYPKVTRAHIADWIMRGWNDSVLSLSYTQLLMLAQRMLILFGMCHLPRKQGFFLYQFISLACDMFTQRPGQKSNATDASSSLAMLSRAVAPTERAHWYRAQATLTQCTQQLLALFQLSPRGLVELSHPETNLVFSPLRLAQALDQETFDVSNKRANQLTTPVVITWPAEPSACPTLQSPTSLSVPLPNRPASYLFWDSIQLAVMTEACKLTRALDAARATVTQWLLLLHIQWLQGQRAPGGSLTSQNQELVHTAHQFHLLIREFTPSYIGLPLLYSPIVASEPLIQEVFAKVLVSFDVHGLTEPTRQCQRRPLDATIAAMYTGSAHRTSTSSIETATTVPKQSDPFIYNPYADKPTGKQGTRTSRQGKRASRYHQSRQEHTFLDGGSRHLDELLVSGESATAHIVLWNPFPFTLEIADLDVVWYQLNTRDRTVHSTLESRTSIAPVFWHPKTIAPHQTMTLQLPFTVPDAPSIVIQGVTLTLFSHLQVHLLPSVQDALRSDGGSVRQGEATAHNTRLVTRLPDSEDDVWLLAPPIAPPLPYLVAQASPWLPEARLDMHLGEEYILRVRLTNTGLSPVNYLALGYQAQFHLPQQQQPENASAITGAGGSYATDHSRPQIISLNDQAAKNAASTVRFAGFMNTHGAMVHPCLPKLDQKWPMGRTNELQFVVSGETNLTQLELHLDYGYIDSSTYQSHAFYQRSLQLPIPVTVGPAITVRSDLQVRSLAYFESGPSPSLQANDSPPLPLRQAGSRTMPLFQQTLEFLSALSAWQQSVAPPSLADRPLHHLSDHWCLLTFKVSNSLHHDIDLAVSVDVPAHVPLPTDDHHPAQESSCTQLRTVLQSYFTSHRTLQFTARIPGLPNTAAALIVIPCPRVCLPPDQIAAAIPIDSSKGQFVVTKDEAERTVEQVHRHQAVYWYQRALSQTVHLKWRMVSTNRQGRLSLLDCRLPWTTLSALKVPDCSLVATLASPDDSQAALISPALPRALALPKAPNRWACAVNTCIQVRITVSNNHVSPFKANLYIVPRTVATYGYYTSTQGITTSQGTTPVSMEHDQPNDPLTKPNAPGQYPHHLGLKRARSQHNPLLRETLPTGPVNNHSIFATDDVDDEAIVWSEQPFHPLPTMGSYGSATAMVPLLFTAPGSYRVHYWWVAADGSVTSDVHVLHIDATG